jgi:hypothetical protein
VVAKTSPAAESRADTPDTASIILAQSTHSKTLSRVRAYSENRKRWSSRWPPVSRADAGGRPSFKLGGRRYLDPGVVEVMSELGVDLSAEFPKPLTDEVVQAADVILA